ncbi:MAG TPA: hypothetical protein VJ746_08500 [Nitrospira sp.]|nr:hypothetical protein [Nitrospira sp.]
MLRSPSTQFLVAVALFMASLFWWVTVAVRPSVQAQDAKRYFYKIVDVPPDNVAIQSVLNEYGAAGWELVVMSMGDMTNPRLIFKK